MKINDENKWKMPFREIYTQKIDSVLPLSGSHYHKLFFTFFKTLCVYISRNEGNGEKHK